MTNSMKWAKIRKVEMDSTKSYPERKKEITNHSTREGHDAK